MKKILLAIALIFSLAAYADDYGITIPEWKDFCPNSFVDVKDPGKLAKFNVIAAYWYQRRVEFEAGLDECALKDANDERFSCYEALKVKQFKENTDYNARIEAKQRAAAGIPEMTNRTDTMLPINNYINNFTRFVPNELR